MDLPEYWLPRPQMAVDKRTQAVFDDLFSEATAQDEVLELDYALSAPKWQFLCYLADQHDIVLHGSGDPHIIHFEPRESNDLNEFGRQKAVFAAADGIWAMFFAIVDRKTYPVSVSNAGIQLIDEDGLASDPFYVFSVSQEVLPQGPWRTGSVYLLPSETFIAQPSMQFGEYEVRILQMASLVPVKPLARLEVSPDDFPFLEQIRGHDDARLGEYATAMQTGGAWPA